MGAGDGISSVEVVPAGVEVAGPVAQALVDAYGQPFVDLVNKISAALTTANVTEMNAAYAVDKEDAETVAADFLEANGLG